MTLAWICRKAFEFIIFLLILSFSVFWIIDLMPGDAYYDPSISNLSSLTLEQDLNPEPVLKTYIDWAQAFLSGNFGTSKLFGLPVSQILFPALFKTFCFVLIGITLTVSLAIFLSLMAHLRHNSWTAKLVNSLSYLSISTPGFWLCLIILYLSSNAFPDLAHSNLFAFLPAMLAFILSHIGIYLRHLNAQITLNLESHYVRTAKAKGQSRLMILWCHVFRNASLPFLGLLSISLGQIFNGTLIIEIIFNFPGAGQLIYLATLNNDYFLAGSAIIFISCATLFSSFITNLYASTYLLIPLKSENK